MWDFNVQLLVLSRGNSSTLLEEASASMMHGLDVSESRTAYDKALRLANAAIKSVEQSQQLGNPDAVISFEVRSEHEPLSNYSECYQGASSLDIKRFRQYFWEVQPFTNWNFHMSTPTGDDTFSGLKWVSSSRQGRWSNV